MAKAPMDEIIREGLQLKFAYKHKDTTFLMPFFTRWQNESLPITDIEYDRLSEVEKAIYDVFEMFYVRGQNLHESEYLVVQNTIDYKVVTKMIGLDTLSSYSMSELRLLQEGRIDDFRPDIKCRGKKVLYLSDKYLEAVTSFYKSGGFFGKREFLLPKMKVQPNHWSMKFYYYVTFPDVHEITFNESLDQARIIYRATFNTGRYAIYERSNSGWLMVKDVEKWIE
ncbi:MAG: hypothetical protein R3F48_03680 [Candidatus Zixiibacteriota bacterium]